MQERNGNFWNLWQNCENIAVYEDLMMWKLEKVNIFFKKKTKKIQNYLENSA